MRQRNWKLGQRIIFLCVVLFLVIGVCTGFYVNDYYHADASAMDVIDNPPAEVQVAYGSDGELIFTPSESNEYDLGIGLIFYPGGKVAYESYAPLMCDLAERGLTCVLVHMPCNLAILDIDRAEGIAEHFPEVTEWYLGGHSLGGVVAAMYLAGCEEDYEGLILLGSYSSKDLSQTDLAVLSIYGSEDGVLNREKYEADKENLPSDYEEYVIEGGCHAGFGSYGAQSGDGTPTISGEEEQEICAEYITRFVSEQ